MKSYFLLLLFFVSMHISHAQNVKQFWKLAEKGEYEKIEKKLNKENAINSESASLHSILGLYYLYSPIKMNYDSSYHHFQVADSLWENGDSDKRATWEKSYVYLDSIVKWTKDVEQFAFDECLEMMKEEEFANYISRFPHSLFLPNAIETRDSLGFETAKKEHSYHSYEIFVRAYPNAKQANEAQEQYELLVYHSKTKDADERILAQFLREHPNNKYKIKVERQLYHLRIENRSISDYIQFIRDYPNSIYADTAINHLWYFSVNKDSIINEYPNWGEKEYYKEISSIDKQLFPVEKEGEIVFLENDGTTFLAGNFIKASQVYNCNGTNGRYLEVTKKSGTGWVDRKGKEVVACQYDKVTPLLEGLVIVEKNGKSGVYALNEGEWLPTIYDQVLRISNRLFGVRRKARWGIISIEGDVKFPIEAGQLIRVSDNMVLVMKKGRWANYKESDIHVGNIKTDDSFFKFEGYKLLKEQWYALSEGGKWSIYSPNGKKWSNDELFDEINDSSNETGWMVRKDTLWQLKGYDMKVKIDSMLLPVQVKNRGIIAKWRGQWSAYLWDGHKISTLHSDTLSFINDNLDLLIKKDKNYKVQFNSGKSIGMKHYSSWNITHVKVDSLDHTFLSAKSKKNKKYALLNENGTQVMTPQFSSLEVFSEGVVVAKYGTLQYLYTTNGKKIYKDGYTSIKYEEGVFHLKSKGKYGLFIPDSAFRITPQFEQELSKTHLKKDGVSLWLGKKNGKYGLLTLTNANTAKLYYDKMSPITDRFSFVWEDNVWKLLDVEKNKIVLECEKYEIFPLKNETFWIKYQKRGKFGVFTSTYGDVIYPEFESVENMGSFQNPLFIGKQYVHQAKLNVLLYMNLQGNVVYQSILNEDQYKLLKCY